MRECRGVLVWKEDLKGRFANTATRAGLGHNCGGACLVRTVSDPEGLPDTAGSEGCALAQALQGFVRSLSVVGLRAREQVSWNCGQLVHPSDRRPNTLGPKQTTGGKLTPAHIGKHLLPQKGL